VFHFTIDFDALLDMLDITP